jgi:hypothetical protein
MTKLPASTPRSRHELTHANDVKPGEEFDLYGHRWTSWVVRALGRWRVDRNGDRARSAVVKIDAATYRNEDRR